MSDIHAVFFEGNTATTLFVGSEKQYLANKGRNDVAVRKLDGTPWTNKDLSELPTLEEFDATVAGT